MFRLLIQLYDSVGYVRDFEFLFYEYPESEEFLQARLWVMVNYMSPGGSIKQRLDPYLD